MQQTGPKVSGKFFYLHTVKFFYVHKVKEKPWAENIFRNYSLIFQMRLLLTLLLTVSLVKYAKNQHQFEHNWTETTLNCKEKIQIISSLGLGVNECWMSGTFICGNKRQFQTLETYYDLFMIFFFKYSTSDIISNW